MTGLHIANHSRARKQRDHQEFHFHIIDPFRVEFVLIKPSI
jgi:hypothetical protein